jgi:multidrug efflux pump
MTGIVDWAASRARMILAFMGMTLILGAYAYTGLPKEGEPDIEVPVLFVSVPFPGISALDSESLLVRPMETELSGLNNLRRMTATAAQNYAGIALEFEFDWDRDSALADVRDRMSRAAASFPAGAENYSINELNFSEFPIIIFAISGDVPERTLYRAARDLQTAIESLDPVLSATIAGTREEMIEVLIDPLRLESYNVTAGELIQVITNNNLLVAAGEVETETGRFSFSLPGSFESTQDIYNLPVKTNGDSTVTLGDLATIQLTFRDRESTARFNGETTMALQVVKRKGFNLIDTVAQVRAAVDAEIANWPEPMRAAIHVTPALDRSFQVGSMISQLEGSVLTAIALVMIVVLASLGTRSALLVGFAIPTSFLLTFILLGVMGVTISNIVMFGLILAVGMLVDGAVVVTEFADKRIAAGDGPMRAYVNAAKRMFWPVVASTATTLCAFLPMLFWPGVAGQFMGMLPVTLIFVLCASLIVALVFLPVLGGVTGRIARQFARASMRLRRLTLPLRVVIAGLALGGVGVGVLSLLNPGLLGFPGASGGVALLLGGGLASVSAMAMSITLGSIVPQPRPRAVQAGRKRTLFGHFIGFIVGNPIMPFVAIGAVIGIVVGIGLFFRDNNRGVDFFVATEPEQGIIYVRARGDLSLAEKDALLRQVEEVVLAEPGVVATFAFGGRGGLNANTAGAQSPRDAIAQIQFELVRWEDRAGALDLGGRRVIDRMQAQLDQIPGIFTEFLILSMGPGDSKPLNLRLTGIDFDTLSQAVDIVRARMAAMPGLIDTEDSRPLPGIDWQLRVDTAQAGRFGADVATVGGMVQLVTRGLLLDTMRVDSSDEEIDIRVRLPESDRLMSTMDTLRVQTRNGMVPLSNFVTMEPVPLRGQIDRFNEQRYYSVRSAVASGLYEWRDAEGRVLGALPREDVDARAHRDDPVAAQAARARRDAIEDAGQTLSLINANERIAILTEWLTTENPLPAGIGWEWTGEQQDQQESTAFLSLAFSAALGLMFVILLAQFNSFYNAVLVLLAVILSTAGVLVGMIVMDQPFSVIMTGTGIVALAGIVVNNNIVLIDTYQEYRLIMPRIEAIIRTAEDRIRPVLLTTITTMAGLTPMMLGVSLDFGAGGYTVGAPTALWWTQLATAVVFGLGVATILTLIFTPAMLGARIWVEMAFAGGWRLAGAAASKRLRLDRALAKRARKVRGAEIIWDPEAPSHPVPAQDADAPDGTEAKPLRAAE